MILDLTRGFGDFPEYKLFKFPGGEIHFKAKIDLKETIKIETRINSSDDLITLALVVDTCKKEGSQYIMVYIPYMPYAQADRDFSRGESFSLKTITNILNNLPVDKYYIFDPHSDVAPALLKNCEALYNDSFIMNVMLKLNRENLLWLSPDAGAYKKIFKLAERVGFKGEILCCQKDRNTTTGEVQVVVPTLPLKDILIIDDICVGGRTFIEISKKIRNTEGRKVYLAVSHGIFSNGFTELAHHFTTVFTTNSRCDIYSTESFGKVPQTFLQQFKII